MLTPSVYAVLTFRCSQLIEVKFVFPVYLTFVLFAYNNNNELNEFLVRITCRVQIRRAVLLVV